MPSPRRERLLTDYRQLQALKRLNAGLIDFAEEGNPPDHYLVQLRVKGLRWVGAGPVFTMNHQFRLELGTDYPRAAPHTHWLTDIFHPNINPPEVCHKGMWGASWFLVRWVQILYDWTRFAAYNPGSPLNGNAAKWASENAWRLRGGVDRRPLKLPEIG